MEPTTTVDLTVGELACIIASMDTMTQLLKEDQSVLALMELMGFRTDYNNALTKLHYARTTF